MIRLALDAVRFLPLALVCHTLWLLVFTILPVRLHNVKYPIASIGHMYSRIREVRTRKDVDVLFIGSSLTYRGVDTRVFSESGLNTFNLGSSSQMPMNSLCLMRRYLDTLHPGLTVIEVNSELFQNDGVESSLDILANDHIDLPALKMALSVNSLLTYNCLLYGAWRQVLGLNEGITEKVLHGNQHYLPGGYAETVSDDPEPMMDSEVPSLDPDSRQLGYLREMTELLKAKGYRWILVYPPVSKDFYRRCGDPAVFNRIFRRYGPYYNFNDNPAFSDSLGYVDGAHLNREGALRFSRSLTPLVRAHLW
jgi:hypothetical protein